MNMQTVYRKPSTTLSKKGKTSLYDGPTIADGKKQNENSRHGRQQHHPRFHEVRPGPNGNGLNSTKTDVHSMEYTGEKSKLLE